MIFSTLKNSLQNKLIKSGIAALLVALPIQAQNSLREVEGARIIDAAETTLKLELGKGTLIQLKRPAREVFIANPEIADIQVKSPRVVYIFGKARGETSFYALDDSDKVIYSSDIAVTQNLGALTTAFNNLLPGKAIDISTVGSMVVLQGFVSSPEEAARAERLARSVSGTEDVMNNLVIRQPTQVNLRVRIAEVSRNVLKQLGFNWQGGVFGSDVGFGIAQGRPIFNTVANPVTGLPEQVFIQSDVTQSLFGSLATGNIDLNYAIDALDQQGFINVLAEPNLTALTGQTANFLAGGEFPVPIPSENGLAIQFRQFGVQLDFTPTVLNTGKISMHVRPEVSSLSTAGAIQIQGISVPSISTRRAETTVELGSGQSFAIAGLLQNNVVQDTNKIPGLGDLPILGALFRSEEFRREETELLIVVTPYVVQPVSDRQLALPTDGYIAPTDAQRYLNGNRWQATVPRGAQAQDQQTGPSLKNRAGFKIN